MVLLVVVTLSFAAVAVRLADIQLVSTGRYASYGKAELVHTEALAATRGTIYARNGTVLAMSLPVTTVIADDFQIHDPAWEARQLAPLLGQRQATIQAMLSEHSGYVAVGRQVRDGVAAKIEALNLPGLTFQPGEARFLPNGALAQSLVGQVNDNGVGYSGLEAEYDHLLSGRAGSQVVQLDPAGRPIAGGTESLRPVVPGQGLVLTLDPAIQYEAEQAVSQEITATHASSGWAVVLDSHTGDVLALVSLAAGRRGGPPQPANTALALTNLYEPGSVAKIATFAGALMEHKITPSTRFVIPPDLPVGGVDFTDAEYHGTVVYTASHILQVSSNIGTIEVAKKLGPYGLYHWLRAVGWGRPTGLRYPATPPGILPPPSTWSGSTMGSMPIGQAEAVSAMQIADAYNMVANGGLFIPPRLVQATVGPGGHRHRIPGTAPHRVLTPRVAHELTRMFENVVSVNGTAPLAAVPGYTVAGKTGTAQIPLTNAPGYQPGAFMGTFAGFVPARNPALTIVVTLDRPNQDYGGTVAAPVFSQIASYALRRLDIPPTSGGVSPSTPATTIGPSAAAAPGH